MATTERTAFIEAIRDLADLLDAHPNIPVPYALSSRAGLVWYVHGDIETVLAIRELMDDALTLPYDSTGGNFPVEVTGTFAGFATEVLVAREIALDPREGFIVQRPAMNPRLLAAEPVKA